MKHFNKQAFDDEVRRARGALANQDYACAYRHVERAHIIGQRHVWPHTHSHLLFLLIGYRRRDYREILGQLARIPLGMLGSEVVKISSAVARPSPGVRGKALWVKSRGV